MKQKISEKSNGLQECLYYGLFVDPKDLMEKVESAGLTEHLERIEEEPHITFAYNDGVQPFEFRQEFVGRRVRARVTGYGKDLKNEGLRVELIDVPEAMKETIVPGKVLHITVSIARDGQAKNTGFLNFEDIEPFEVEGEFNGRFKDFDIRRHCESRFVFPFYLKAPGKKILTLDENIWKPSQEIDENGVSRQVDLRYLATYIEKIYEYDNDIVHIYDMSDEGFERVLGLKRGEKLTFREDKREYHSTDLLIYDISAYCFTTGINYLVLTVVYEKNTPLAEMAYAVGRLSYLLQKGNHVWRIFRKEDRTETDLGIGPALKNSIRTNLNEEAKWFHIQQNEKGTGFHRLLLEREKEEDDSLYIFEMMKGVTGWSDSREEYEKILRESILEITNRQNWAINSNGLVSYVYAPLGEMQAQKETKNQRFFLLGAYQYNVRHYYFEEFILALQERDCFLNFNNEAVCNWKNSKKLIQLREDILMLNTWATYDVVSTEANYQNFYEKVYKELKLAMLEKDVEEVIEKTENYTKDRREGMTNGILLGIGVLAVFSALIDATDFIEKFYGTGRTFTMGDLPHILIYLLIALMVAAGVAFGIHHSRRKK